MGGNRRVGREWEVGGGRRTGVNEGREGGGGGEALGGTGEW